MAMFLIAGSFRITGAQPDGDSIRFTPDDPAKWDLITGTRVKRNASGAAQLRLDVQLRLLAPKSSRPQVIGRRGALGCSPEPRIANRLYHRPPAPSRTRSHTFCAAAAGSKSD